MNNFRERLSKGDMPTTVESDQIAKEIIRNPYLFPTLFSLILDEDPAVRIRAADAAEKVSAKHHEYLQPHKKTVIKPVTKIPQQEVRWHSAQMVSYLNLTTIERIATLT